MRVLLILLLLPILTYGGVMGYIWYELKDTAGRAAQAAASFAAISYDTIHISPLGDEIGYDNIVIKPVMTNDEFRIEKVRISGPDIVYFIQSSINLNNGKLPEVLSVQFLRTHIDLNSKVFSLAGKMMKQASQSQSGKTESIMSNLDAIGCGDIESFTLNDYRRMGLGAIVGDATFYIKYDELRNNTHAVAEIVADNLYSMVITVDLNSSPQHLNSRQAANTLKQSTINYRDIGYYKLRNDYCAGQNDSDVDAYIDRHVSMAAEKIGATFPEEAVAGYKQLMRKGGTLNFRIRPTSDISLNGLEYYKPADIVYMLRLSVAINGKKLDVDNVQWADHGHPVAVATTAIKEEAPKKIVPQTSLPVVKKTEPTVVETSLSEASYKVINVADAHKYLKSMVEVTTAEGKVRSGLLEQISDRRIYMTIKLTAGYLNYPVEISNIAELRVSK